MENNEMNENQKNFIKFFNEEIEKVKKMNDEELFVHMLELKRIYLEAQARLVAARLKWR